MARHLVLVTVTLFALVLTAEACGPPAADAPPDSPAAEATNVRRTAVAAVQRIIANNPAPTPLPTATVTPMPTCQNAIWWNEARSHVGETRTVQGTIVSTRPGPGGVALLEMGQPYPDPTGLVIIGPSAPAPETFSGKTVCAAGRIILAEGRPALQVRDSAAIVALD